jgi:hypothetical protein
MNLQDGLTGFLRINDIFGYQAKYGLRRHE